MVGGGRARGLGGKMVLLGPARVLAVEQTTEVESQVAAVVWLAHGGSLIRAAPEHSSWLRDLRNLRRTEYADLGNPPTESERWMLGKIPMVENSNHMVIISHHHQIQMLCWHLQLQNHRFHSILLEILLALHLVSMLFDFVTVLDGFSHDEIHIKAHTMSQQIHLACKMNQGLLLEMDSQSELTSQIMLLYQVM